MGESRLKMASTQTNAAIPVQEAAISEKDIELSEEKATSDDGNRRAAFRPVQAPGNKLEETFTGIPPEEVEYGENEPEDDAPDAPWASGSSSDEIDGAVRAAKNPEAAHGGREKVARVSIDVEGTELYDKITKGSSEIAARIEGLIGIRTKKPRKEFVVSDNTKNFDIHDYV